MIKNFDKKYFLLMGILLLFLFSRNFMLHEGPIDTDEGYYLSDSIEISEGKSPYTDFWIRSPLYVFFNFLSGAIFSFTFEGARMFSILAQLLTLLIIFFVVKKKTNINQALFTTFLFSVSWVLLRFGTSGVTESIDILFLTSAFSILVYAIEKNDEKLFFLHGLILGATFFIRRSNLIFFILEPILLKLIFKTENKKIVISSIGYLSSITLGFLILLCLFGFNSIFETFYHPIFEADFFSKSIKWIFLYMTYIISDPLIFIPPTFLLISAIIEKSKKLKQKALTFGIKTILLSLLIVLIITPIYLSLKDPYYLTYLSVSYFIGLVLFFKYPIFKKEKSILFKTSLIWFIPIFIFHLSLSKIYKIYVLELIVPLIFISGEILPQLFEKRKKTVIATVFLTIMMLGVFSIDMLTFPDYKTQNYRPAFNEITKYLEENTTTKTKIFTLWNGYTFNANRRPEFYLTRMYSYKFDTHKHFNYPEISKLKEKIKNKEFDVIISDFNMKVFLLEVDPDINKLILENYEVKLKIMDTTIFEKK